jgi:hypothetical protein
MPAPRYALNTSFTNGMSIVGVIDHGNDGPAEYLVDGVEGSVTEAQIAQWEEVQNASEPSKPHSGDEPAE